VPLEFEMATEKLKRHKSPGIDQIPAKLIKAVVEKFALKSINLLIIFGMRRNCPKSGRSRSWYLFMRRAIQQILVIIEAHHFVNYVQIIIQHPAIKLNSICRGN
jgi:hypothetical protein